MWALLLSFVVILGQTEANAAPTVNDAWVNVHAATNAALTVNATSALTVTVTPGSRRLVMVAVHMEKTTAATLTLNAATFGGVALTPIASTFGRTARMHTWMGYLPEAQIPAGASAVNFQATSPTGNITGIQINVASYAGVEQSAPITAFTENYAGAVTVAFPASLSYAANSLTVFATANGGAAATLTTNATGGAAFAAQSGASATIGAFSGYVAVSAANVTSGSYTTATNAVFAGTTNVRSSLVAASINPYIPVTTSTAAGTVTATVLGANRISIMAPYEEDSNANNTLLVEYKRSIDPGYTTWANMTHSATPYSTTITGLTESTSYDIRVTYQDINGVTGTAVQLFPGTTTRAKGIESFQSWTNVIKDVTVRTTAAAANLSGSYAVTAPSGSGRYLVMAITHYNTANVASAAPSVITYDGVALTLGTSNRATSARTHTSLYYLKDNAVMDGTSKTVNVQWTTIASTEIDVYCAVFTGVDQTVPVVVGTGLNNTANTTPISLSTAMSVGANRLAIYAMNDVNIASTTIPGWTPNANWTTPTSDVAPSFFTGTSGSAGIHGFRHEFAQRMIPGTTVTDNAMTASTRSVSSVYSVSAMVLPPLSVSLTTGAAAPNLNVYAGDTGKVADAFTMNGSGLITSIQVTGNSNTTSSNISAIRIYRKGDANTTVYTPGVDVLAGTGAFGAVGTTPVNIAVNENVSGTTNYIIVYDIASGAIASGTSVTFTGAVTATTPAPGGLADTGATLTLFATTTLGNTTEPAAVRLWRSSAATNLDAFTLQHSGAVTTDDDTISNITVTMSPQYISGGSGGTVSKIKLMEIVDSTGTTVYGSVNLPTTGDIWNIPLTGLVATPTLSTYYVRVSTADTITPSGTDTSGTPEGYYAFNGKVTSFSHSKGTSRVVNSDTSSQTLMIDVEKPIGPTTATAVTGSNNGEIDLSWDNSANDPNGGSLYAVAPYLIRRSAPEGGVPNPGCIDGTDLSTVPGVTINYAARSVTDKGLVDVQATQYQYRVCSRDSLGNLSTGATALATAKVNSVCTNPPSISLIPDSQIVKSTGTPFTLQIANTDTGTCPDVVFSLALANEAGAIAKFDKSFPATVTLGTGGAGGPTGTTVPIMITGRPEAFQLEQYKFAIRVTSPGGNHGAPQTTVQVTGILNDMPPIVHNSGNMGKYQYGSWGETYTCATCHSNSTTNIKGVYTVISTPIGRRNVTFSKTSSTEADNNGVFSNDLRSVKNVSYNVCSVCHHRTRQHQYSANKVGAVVGPQGDELYNPDHHNSRDCVRCHTHNTAFRSIYGLCGDCHGFKNTGYSPINKSTMVKSLTNALGPAPPNYGAHQRHNTAGITCSACHSNTNHGLATAEWLGDDILEIGFKTSKFTFPGFNVYTSKIGGKFYGTNNLNAPFVWSAGPSTTITQIADYNNSCNTYCHGNWPGNAGSQTQPIWVGGSTQVACGSCHYATAAVPLTSGSHLKHAANTGAGLGIACNKCHASYANYTGSAHINGRVEWSMTAYPGSAYKGSIAGSTDAPAPTATINYGECSNLYCHSNIQNPTTGLGAPTTYATPTWGGTAPCGSCHVYPNTTGSHVSHENEAVAFDCHVCHNNGGTTAPLKHGDGTIDFQFVGLAQNTTYSRGNAVAPGTAYGTCSTSDCHGRFTRAWGTPDSGLPMCEKCHGSATSAGGFYNTRGPTGTLSIYSTGVGVHDIHIQNMNSPRKTTFARFTSYAAPYKCNQCHYTPTSPFTAGHIDTALPAESAFSHASSIANKGILFQYYSTPTYTKATETCSAVWCHGAGMHSNRATDEYAGTTPPVRTNPKWTVPYLTGNGASDCTKCHAMPPPAPDNTYTHYGKTLVTCTTCHKHVGDDGYSFKDKKLHVNGTVEGGCDGCHGDPPITAGVWTPVNTTGLATPAQNALNGGAGAHAAHILLPLIGKNCSTCHNAASPAMPSNELEIGFNALGGLVNNGTFTGYTNSVNGPKWKIPSASAGTTIVKSNVKAAVCSNLYCHGGGSTSPVRPALGGGTNTSPDWEIPAVCGDCHGVDSASAPTGGSHPKHALTVASLSCSSCHGITADNGTHVNAQVQWKLDRSNPVIGANATYNNISSGSLSGLAPRGVTTAGDDYRTCNNIYCHSSVQGTNGTGVPVSFKTPRWGTDNNTLTCASCHQNMATDPSPTGSHLKHANPSLGMNVPCGYCHQDAGAGFSTMHTDGSIFINFTSYIGGAYSVGTPYMTGVQKAAASALYGSCSATFCHGNASSPTWGTSGPLACNACHSAKVDDASWSGRHKTHYNYSTMPTSYTQIVTDLSSVNKYRFNCAHCHDDNLAKHSLKPASADSAARVFFGISTASPASSSKRGTYLAGAPMTATDNGFNFTAGSCNGTYCHSNARGGLPKQTFLNWTTRPTAGSNCLFCHDNKSITATASTLSPRHDKHMNPTNNVMIGTGNGFNCVDCHSRTITNSNNITIANKGKHVNAMLDYSGAKAGSTYASGICSNVYCHSNGNPNALVFVSMTGSKRWTDTGTITTCNKCHGRSNSYGYPDYANGGANQPTSNLHAGHMQGLASTTACSDCHRKTPDTLVANKFRPYSTAHMTGTPNVHFNTAKAYIGTKAAVNTAGYQVTCSNVICHGQGAPVWGSQPSGGAGVRTCTKCHGTRTAADYLINYSSALIAPGYNGEGTDTSMTKAAATDARVGAHQRHLVSNVISAPVKCGECHVPVTAIRAGNHWNYSTATLTFNGRATANSHVPTVSRTGGIMQCSNTNCHTGKYNSGTTIAPFWNMTGLVKETGTTVAQCVKCHAMPPSGYSQHPPVLSNLSSMTNVYNRCSTCHNTLKVNPTGVANVFTDKALHVDGIVQVSMPCNGCHDYDTNGGTWGNVTNKNYGGTPGIEGRGAHYKHIEYLKTRNSVTLNPTTDTYGNAAMTAVCGVCHSISAGDHSMDQSVNTRTINFGGSTARQLGGSTPAYSGSTATSSSVNPKSCSNIDCHYRTSPIWSTY